MKTSGKNILIPKKETEYSGLKSFQYRQDSMEELIHSFKNKSIHIVGVTGAEGSSILRFLIKHKISHIILHDFINENELEKSFKLWHKGISVKDRNKLYQKFISDLSLFKLNLGVNYLKDIKEADLVFVPQSWRLYKKVNSTLFQLAKNIQFYSLTRLYLDYAPAQIIAVTGTVGKGSVAYLLVQILKKAGRTVFFAGNETWMPQLADKLDTMKSSDILVLEISHRQILDGFDRAPHMTIFTNLYPNHLDELSWEEYKKVKLSLLERQKPSDSTIINWDSQELRKIVPKLNSKVIYYSAKSKNMNIKSVQNIFRYFMNNNSVHYFENIMAVSTTASILDISEDIIRNCIKDVSGLPARLEFLTEFFGVKFFDDLRSTTPWATIAAVNKLTPDVILISGGRTKGIDYRNFVETIKGNIKHLILIKSELSDKLSKLVRSDLYSIAEDLNEAIKLSYKISNINDKVIVSPAAAFFYTDFIRGKKSVKKIITSLLPKEKLRLGQY